MVAWYGIPCFDRCELIITWMSNIREVHSKPRLHVSLLSYYLNYGRHLARLRRRRRRRRRAYAPTSNTASHDNHEKIHWCVSFSLPFENGAPLGGPSGRRSSAITNKKAQEPAKKNIRKAQRGPYRARQIRTNSLPLDLITTVCKLAWSVTK